jgi:hypothetical protein
MLRKPSKIRRAIAIVRTAVPSIGSFAASMWRSETGHKWMVPLVVFLCLMGLFLLLSATVEALAPFIYSIF